MGAAFLRDAGRLAATRRSSTSAPAPSRSSTGSPTARAASWRRHLRLAAASATARPSPRCSTTRRPTRRTRIRRTGSRCATWTPAARLPERQLRRGRLVLVDRALRRAGRHRALGGEIGRVLRPGGHAFLVTEVFVEHHPIDRAPSSPRYGRSRSGALQGRDAAPAHDRRVLHAARAAQAADRAERAPLMQPLRLEQSPASRANVHSVNPDGSVTSSTGAPYPHLAIRAHRSTFSSICLPLVKPSA